MRILDGKSFACSEWDYCACVEPNTSLFPHLSWSKARRRKYCTLFVRAAKSRSKSRVSWSTWRSSRLAFWGSESLFVQPRALNNISMCFGFNGYIHTDRIALWKPLLNMHTNTPLHKDFSLECVWLSWRGLGSDRMGRKIRGAYKSQFSAMFTQEVRDHVCLRERSAIHRSHPYTHSRRSLWGWSFKKIMARNYTRSPLSSSLTRICLHLVISKTQTAHKIVTLKSIVQKVRKMDGIFKECLFQWSQMMIDQTVEDFPPQHNIEDLRKKVLSPSLSSDEAIMLAVLNSDQSIQEEK